MVITMDRAPDVRANGGLDYISSMVTSWNKFCFTGGISALFPGPDLDVPDTLLQWR
jgi:hypothetical protein